MAQRSPRKPRILWRGELHLPDGTALPGLAIVSTTEPLFVSQSSSRAGHSASGGGSERHDGIFTLSKENQDELSLAIEMVRHAPLRVVDVKTDLGLDAQGRLSLVTDVTAKENGKLPNGHSAVPHLPSTLVTYEAAGDVRLHVDPAEQSTVAFFERTFAYDAYGARFLGNDTLDEAERDQHMAPSLARSSMIFSFDKIPTTTAIQSDGVSDGQDVFSSAYTLWSSSEQASHRLCGDGAMEAAIVGVVRRTANGTFDCVELHVGRKIARRVNNAATNKASTNLSALPRSLSTTAIRPDDPAPRFASRATLPSFNKLPFSSSKSTSAILQASRGSQRTVPPAMASTKRPSQRLSESSEAVLQIPAAAVEATKKRGGAHTPGRRGEKRSRKATSEAIHIHSPSALQPSPPGVVVKTEAGSTAMASVPATLAREVNAGGTEEQNRSLIKKLVHYQLLGKGVERHEETYAACFGPTCQGALLAFRKVVKLELIDKQTAASIVERHLDMYL